ncbi:hypothetical protein HanIR_Chr03g0147551 [Helianthus annuus]|nr:hypothetical protein HanIR_Chr03g0147551 [Helianthus annuus]
MGTGLGVGVCGYLQNCRCCTGFWCFDGEQPTPPNPPHTHPSSTCVIILTT